MLTERELDKLLLLAQLPFLFGAQWWIAVSRLTLELGEKRWTI